MVRHNAAKLAQEQQQAQEEQANSQAEVLYYI